MRWRYNRRCICRVCASALPLVLLLAAVQKVFADESKHRYVGIGFNAGIRISSPSEINGWLDDVYENMKEGYIVIQETGTSSSFMGFSLGTHVLVRPLSFLCIVPTFSYYATTKKLATGSMSNVNAQMNLRDVGFGGELYALVPPRSKVSAKVGVGVDYHLTTLELEEQNTVTLKGSTVGVAPLAGICIKPGKRRVLIHVDILVPIVSSNLTEVEGEFNEYDDDDAWDVPLPGNAVMSGVQIRPGISICF